jgi:hypothetical protein
MNNSINQSPRASKTAQAMDSTHLTTRFLANGWRGPSIHSVIENQRSSYFYLDPYLRGYYYNVKINPTLAIQYLDDNRELDILSLHYPLNSKRFLWSYYGKTNLELPFDVPVSIYLKSFVLQAEMEKLLNA